MTFAAPRHTDLWKLVVAETGGHDLAHDEHHVLRVYQWAVHLARSVGADTDLAGAAALIHDLVHVPKDQPDRPLASAMSADASTPLLRAAGYDDDAMRHVQEAVRTTSWSRGLRPTSLLGAVLQDADRLDAIGAIGIARVFACAQSMQRPGAGLYHPEDPLAERVRPLDDARHAVDHFRAKLLHLAGGMHTAEARAEGARRHAAMLAFLETLRRDLALPDVTVRNHPTSERPTP